MEGALHPNSKNANILKAVIRKIHILKALQLFKGNSVIDALHRRVCYFQTKVSIILMRAFSDVRDSDMLFPNDWGGLVSHVEVLASKVAIGPG